jgi:hypothetical protein
MMARTQITLSPEEHRRARARAAELGISLAEYIRRLVRDDLGEPRRATDLSAIAGLGNSGGSDIARFKDQYIGEAVEAEWKRKTGRT